MKRLLLGAAALVAMSGTASAAEVGFCATAEKMTEVMLAEGQISVIKANRAVLRWQDVTGKWHDEPKFFGITYSMDAEAKVGYSISSDKSSQERGTRYCVSGKFYDLRLFDVRKPGTPETAKIKVGSEGEAKARCDELVRQGVVGEGRCRYLNATFSIVERYGERPALQGYGATKGPDGKLVVNRNALITVMMNLTAPPSKDNSDFQAGAQLITSLPSGATGITAVLTDMVYTESAVQALAPR